MKYKMFIMRQDKMEELVNQWIQANPTWELHSANFIKSIEEHNWFNVTLQTKID